MARRTRQTLKIAAPTRLPATDERYRSIASMAKRQMRLSELEPERAIRWLRAKSKTVQYVTLRLYRAAIRLSLTEELDRQKSAGSDGARWAAAIAKIKSVKRSPLKIEHRRRPKYKELRLRALSRLLLWLDVAKQESTYAEATRLWLTATLLTGLRPIEWQDVQWIGPNPFSEPGQPAALLVRNAKATNGRGNGETRLLQFDLDTPAIEMQIIYLWAQIATGHSAQGGFGKLYSGCQRLLYKANRSLWPRASRIYSLYSARHQFGANAKQKLSREEVAALMGHITIDTAARHYGRRRVGTPRTTTPKPDPLAVMRVRSHEISKVNPWMDTQISHDFGGSTPAE